MNTVLLGVLVGAYLVGSIPFGFVIGLARGHNLLREGSGNIGGTNAERVLGKIWGTIVLLLDISKAFVPAYLSMRLLGYNHSLAANIGACAVLGHCYSVFLGFRGGKGVACLLGVGLAISPWVAVAAWVISKIVKKVTRYASVASMVGAVVLWLLMLATRQPSAVHMTFLVLALLIILRHEANIRRIMNGTEPKVFRADARGGFAINSPTGEIAYFREKVGGKYLFFIPKFLWPHLLTDKLILWLRANVSSIRMGKVTGVTSIVNGRSVEMVFVATTKTADWLQSNPQPGCLCVINLVQKYLRKGIKFWGLGGSTSIVTEGGSAVAGAVNPQGGHVTSGNSLTAESCFDAAIRLAERCLYDIRQITVTIIGGRGSMGKVLARMFSPLVKEVILVGRPGTNLTETVQELAHCGFHNITWESELPVALAKSLLVVSVASTTKDMEIDPTWFLTGSIVVDASRPRSMGEKLAERPDILVVAGGLWRLPPGGFSTFNFGLHRTEVLACMAETLVWLLEGREHENHSLGTELRVAEVKEVGQLARKHGFTAPRLRGTDDKPITAKKLQTFFEAVGLDEANVRRNTAELTAVPPE